MLDGSGGINSATRTTREQQQENEQSYRSSRRMSDTPGSNMPISPGPDTKLPVFFSVRPYTCMPMTTHVAAPASTAPTTATDAIALLKILRGHDLGITRRNK
jgi:hypothetical protein